MLYYKDIKLRRRRRGMYRRETSYIYVLGAKPLDEPLTNIGDTLQRCYRPSPNPYSFRTLSILYLITYLLSKAFRGLP